MTEIKLPPLPKPFKNSGQQMSYDGRDKVFFDCYTNDQMTSYGLNCRADLVTRVQELEESLNEDLNLRMAALVRVAELEAELKLACERDVLWNEKYVKADDARLELEGAAKLALEASKKFINKVHSGKARSIEAYDDLNMVRIALERAGIK